MSERYLMLEPSSRCTVRLAPSTRTTWRPKRNVLSGSVRATAFQIPPVPPCAGNLKVALGPQLPATFLLSTLETTSLSEGAATRSPSHLHCMRVVGTAHTL